MLSFSQNREQQQPGAVPPGYPGYPQQPMYPQLPGLPNQTPAAPGLGMVPMTGAQPPAVQPHQHQSSNPFHFPHLHFHHPPPQNQMVPMAGAGAQPGALAPLASGAPMATWAARTGYGYGAGASQLQPQPLETVAKDEDPVYGPLGRARGKVQRALVSDNEISPDLADLFMGASENPYPAPPPNSNSAFRPAYITRTTPLPDALHRELNCEIGMGLFEEIERAWLTVDNKLFLWDYNDGRLFSRYDQQSDTIQAVGLVRARKDVFVDDITHLLIICTANKASLLGLSRSDKGELALYATNLTVDTGTVILDIRGTDSGRIFLLGINKDLYELEYTTGGGWFGGGSKMWMTNRSSSYLSTWMPSVFSTGTREGIEQFVVDPQQNRLFALHTRGDIEWFDINGTGFEPRGKYSNLRSDFTRLGYGGSAPSYAGSNIVSIAVVGGHESKKAWAVAIAASGARAYLGNAYYPTNYGAPFTVIGIRAPPPDVGRADRKSFYSAGTFISVRYDESPSPTSQLTFVTPLAGRQSAMRENYDNIQNPSLQEWHFDEVLSTEVWTIAEVTATDPARAPPALQSDTGIALSALPRQTTAAARQFLILATTGIYWALQPRPIDMLEGDLELEKDAAVHTARAAFGRVQLAAMGVQMGLSPENSQADVISASTNILLASDPPMVRASANGNHSIIYSPRHDGLALILGRILRAIWNSKVTAPAGKGMFKLGVPDGTLLDVQGRLSAVRRFLEEHPFPRHQAEGDAKIAWDQEELSLHGLQTLLKLGIEAISFVLLLSDYKLPDVIAKCDAETQGTLASLTFQGLLTSQDGRNVARKLVTALIELQIGAEVGIDSLSAILQQRCGTFVQPGDVVLYKAEESLRRAEGTRDAAERSENLAESLRLFSRAASSAAASVFSRLPDATHRFRALNDVRGTIELPLRVATEIDRDDKAGDYVRDGRNPGDPREAFFEQRQECYKLVVEALNSYDDQLNQATAAGKPDPAVRARNEAYALAITSDDELWHFYLYDWTVEMGRADQLLEYDTPFIERYLQCTVSNHYDRRDLLWKFYSRREDYLPAANALYDLATRDSDMTLDERVFYLAQALTNAKSAASVGSEDVEFTTTVQERIDVAQVQLEVYRAIESHPDMSPAERAGPLEQLNGQLLSLDDLYLTFARPLRLFEPILLILKTADTRVEAVCEAVWRQLILQRSVETPYDAAVGALVTDLCRRYYPSEAAPTDLVLPVVYGEAAPHRESTQPGWASKALLAGGVGLRDLWDAVRELHDEATDTRDFYTEEAAALIGRWLHTQSGLPVADVEQFASAYLLRTNGQQLSLRDAETRKTMQAAKSAAVKF